MKISVDTNVLVRAVLQDEPKQAKIAADALKKASLIAISTPSLCEFTWVLMRGANKSKEEVSAAIRALLDTSKVEMNRPAVEAGLAVLEAGGDFADGVIAYEGAWLGGETFFSFDKQAIGLLKKQGVATRQL
jgi:predicted nucleic-acid-binding protein